MKEKTNEWISTRVTKAEKEYIDKLAKELDLSVSQIMRRALKLYKEKLADSKSYSWLN